MNVQETIERKLSDLEPLHLEVINESDNHHVPPGSESHFKVVIVSPKFEGVRLIDRHRLINETLAQELAGPVHALAIHAYTEANWQSRYGEAPMSPPCLGGSKAD